MLPRQPVVGVVLQKALTLLGAVSSAARTGLAAALARVKGMVQDRDVKTFVLSTLAFSNVITTLVASITQTDGSKALAALEALGVTLGASLNQVVVGLRTLTTPGAGIIGFVTAIATVLFGLSTVYYWYRGNWWFIDTFSATGLRITDHIYISLVLLLAIIAYGDQVQFFQLVDLSADAGQQVVNATEAASPGERIDTVRSTSENVASLLP